MTSAPRATGTYLDRIIADKRDELERALDRRPLTEVRVEARRQQPARDFEGALRKAATTGLAVIAEVKRASPSKGLLMREGEPVALARSYAEAGVDAISVVTEVRHFQGSLDMLHDIREALDAARPERPPLLRKDFLFDPYHIEEARAAGADAILLIAAVLDDGALRGLLAQAKGLGMGVLVEAHDAEEIGRAVAAGATVIGVNNRDLRTFEEDLGTTERLAPFVPPGCLLVSESAIRSRADAQRVAVAGAKVILVGEALVTAGDVAAKLRELRS